MPIFSSLMFRAVRWAARRGLREEEGFSSDAKKLEARRTGVRGETYAYWYLRRNGYVFVARNYTPRGIKGELDLVGYDGNTLAFVEVRTHTVREESPALPELSVTTENGRTNFCAKVWSLRRQRIARSALGMNPRHPRRFLSMDETAAAPTHRVGVFEWSPTNFRHWAS